MEFSSPKKAWQLKGVPQPNVYPVVPRSGSWYLDKRRKNPKLRISRRQVPLAPAFALTAHTAQGMTLEDGVIADCDVPPGTNIITCYIAVTRVREREKLLISRPFPAAPFQQGLAGQRDLLLQCWRGAQPDWAAVRARYNVTKRCSSCDIQKRTNAFAQPQWRAEDATRVCKERVRSFLAQNKPWRCAVCLNFQEIACFPKEAKNPRKTWSRVCNSCMADRRCYRCGQVRTEDMFSARQWKRGGKTGHCKRCARQVCGKPVPAERVSFDRARRFVRSTHRKRTVNQVWKQVHEILRQRDSPSVGEDGEKRRQRLVSLLGEEGDSTDVRTVEACSSTSATGRVPKLRPRSKDESTNASEKSPPSSPSVRKSNGASLA